MRTTIAIDDDVLLAAKYEALRRNVSLGEAATELIRAGLKANTARQVKPVATIGPFAILPPRNEIVTPEHVRRLMEQEGI